METRGADGEDGTGDAQAAADWAPHAEPSVGGPACAARGHERGVGAAAVSVAVHALLLAGLLLFAMPEPRSPPPERSVSVEILDAAQFDAVFRPSPQSLPAPDLPAGLALPSTPPDIIAFPADPPLPPRAGETIVATGFYSAGTLADPRSAKARAALAQLGGDERIVQLCVVEALAQIAALDVTYSPDLVSAYSMSEITLTRTSVDAPGAAFRSHGHWYRLAFTCTVTSGLDQVAGFAFRIGAEIPRVDWVRHNLSDGNDLDDH